MPPVPYRTRIQNMDHLSLKVLVFEVDMSFAEGAAEDAMNAFFDDFLGNVIEANALVFGGVVLWMISLDGFSGWFLWVHCPGRTL